jgi:quercetin dioxygenase-like cupin family protein
MQSSKMTVTFGLAVVMATGALLFGQAKQADPVKRTVLQRGDVSVPGREGVSIMVEFAPGASTGRHTHPGDEIDYVIEGNGELLIDGQPAKMIKPGDASVIPGGTVHDARNTGSQPLKVLAVMVVEKRKPMTTPAK